MAWTADQLDRLGGSEELNISSHRSDGSLRRWIPIWVVRVDDDIYIRSAYGDTSGWYRRALAAVARVQAGGVESDARLEPVDDEALNAQITAAYETKYASMPSALAPMLIEPALSATVRILPAD